MLQHAEAILELNRSALVEAEQVARLRAEAVSPQVFVEPMRQVKVACVRRQRKRRRQVDEGEIRLHWTKLLVVVLAGRLGGGGGRLRVGGGHAVSDETQKEREQSCRRASDHGWSL